LKIELTTTVIAAIHEALRKAQNREIGGILMGEQLSPGEFRVIDITIDSHSGSPNTFERQSNSHLAKLEKFFERTGNDFARFNYLGEWHSHPNHPLFPSETDIESMNNIVSNEENISFAVLMLVRSRRFRKLEASAFLIHEGQPPASVTLTVQT
jgi:integrative and conjugative element protein (TIGR02256 family)